MVLVAGYLLLIAPKITELKTSQVTAQQGAVSELKTQQLYADALAKSNTAFATAIPAATQKKIDTFLPSTANFPSLILTVKNMVTQARLTLNSISVSQSGQVAAVSAATPITSGVTSNAAVPKAQAATATGVGVKTQDISISVSGGTTYEAFKSFLSIIESSQQLFDVMTVSFTSGGDTTATTTGGASAGTATWSFVLRTYYLPTN